MILDPFRSGGRIPAARLLFSAALGAALLLSGAPKHLAAAASPPQAPREIRALWVTRATLTTPASIASMVRSASAAGFNTLLVQVRARGDAYFLGGREPRPAALAGQPGTFDPLGLVLEQAHRARLRVHAWVNVNLVANAADMPTSRAHIVYRHPEWLMIPRALASEMRGLGARTPLYRDKLTRWVRGESAEIEGLYLSPIPADSADYTVGAIAALVGRYAVDGVHLDYVRYPNEEFDYSRVALEEFRSQIVRRVSAQKRRDYDRRLASDPFVYTDGFPQQWKQFRRSRLTFLVARLYSAIKRRRPAALLTAAVLPDFEEAVSRRFQEWPAWLERGLLDVACPMAYATDRELFAAQLAAARRGAAGRPLWVGIGAFRLSAAQAAERIQLARRLGVAGIALFSYESVVTPPHGSDQYLSELGRTVFSQ